MAFEWDRADFVGKGQEEAEIQAGGRWLVAREKK